MAIVWRPTNAVATWATSLSSFNPGSAIPSAQMAVPTVLVFPPRSATVSLALFTSTRTMFPRAASRSANRPALTAPASHLDVAFVTRGTFSPMHRRPYVSQAVPKTAKTASARAPGSVSAWLVTRKRPHTDVPQSALRLADAMPTAPLRTSAHASRATILLTAAPLSASPSVPGTAKMECAAVLVSAAAGKATR